MYTKEQALEKFNSEAVQIELHIDAQLEANYRGKELCVELREFSELSISNAMKQYQAVGWSVRPPNMNPDGTAKFLYFS